MNYSTERVLIGKAAVCKAEGVTKSLHLNHSNQEEKDHLLEIVREYPGSFYLPGKPLIPTHSVQHNIHTMDKVSINIRLYRFSFSRKEEVERVIHNMKTEEVIQNSKSPHNSTLLIIAKKIDGTEKKKWRIVIDFRLLNRKTIGISTAKYTRHLRLFRYSSVNSCF